MVLTNHLAIYAPKVRQPRQIPTDRVIPFSRVPQAQSSRHTMPPMFSEVVLSKDKWVGKLLVYGHFQSRVINPLNFLHLNLLNN